MGASVLESRVQRSLSLEKITFAVVGSPRSEIIQCLVNAEKSVSSIAGELELAMGTISHHLAILKRHALVSCRAIGLTRLYRLTDLVRARRRGPLLRLRIRCAAGETVILHRRT